MDDDTTTPADTKPAITFTADEYDTMIRNSRYLTASVAYGDSRQEVERQARGIEHVRRSFSKIPYCVQRAESDLEYWARIFDSRFMI